MANRYRNKNYGRGGEGRGGFGSRSSEYGRGSSDYGQGRYGSSGYGSDYSDYDREEGYYGGRKYGQEEESLRGGERGRGFGSYDRDYDEDYTTGSGGRGSNYARRARRSDYDRESYYGGGSSLNEYGGGGTYGGYSERGDYGRGDYGRGYRGYSENYPESERGYDLGIDEERGWLDKASDEVSSWLGDEEAERRRQMDARRQGSHRGRGPRNYTRSDERIREDINDRLTDHDYLDASDINVEVSGSEVVLTGTVDTRYAKRMAEDIAEDVSGVQNVENRLRVNRSFYGQGSSSFSDTTSSAGINTGTGSATGMPDRASGSTGTTTTGTSSSTTDTTTGKSRGKTA